MGYVSFQPQPQRDGLVSDAEAQDRTILSWLSTASIGHSSGRNGNAARFHTSCLLLGKFLRVVDFVLERAEARARLAVAGKKRSIGSNIHCLDNCLSIFCDDCDSIHV